MSFFGGDEPPRENLTPHEDFDLNNLPILHTRGEDKLTEIFIVGKQTLKIAYEGGMVIEV